jgi:hypothetical protein
MVILSSIFSGDFTFFGVAGLAGTLTSNEYHRCRYYIYIVSKKKVTITSIESPLRKCSGARQQKQCYHHSIGDETATSL